MRRLCAAFVLLFACASVHAGPIGLSALGDSLTDTYAGKSYAGPNQSWTDLLAAHRSSSIEIHNFAKAGSTSSDLVAQGQAASAVSLVQNGTASYVSLAIGANDVYALLLNPSLDPTAQAAQLVGNVAATLAQLQASGAKVVLSNVPNIADTPAVQAALAGNPAALAMLGVLTDEINKQMSALAKAYGVPLVDLQKLNNASTGPQMVGGVDVHNLLDSIDWFHPSSIASALMANVQLEALRRGYGVEVAKFTDAEVLSFGGVTGGGNTSTFNASAYVVHATPEPSSLVLLGVGAAGYALRRRKARR